MNERELKAVGRLCELSRDHAVPLAAGIEWPAELDRDAWYMSPELVSLYGSDTWQRMTEAQQRELAWHEAVNFFSLNVHGEKFLLAGIAERLHRRDYAQTSEYLHHFLDEENKHLFYFSTFCQRYAHKIYAHALLAFPRDDYAPGEQDFVFFASILAFEELVDVYNHRMADDERLAPIARAINRLHHQDETRHRAFGRLLVQEMFARQEWPADTLAGVRERVQAFIAASWRQYYNPEVYRDAGLAEPFALARTAFDSEPARRHRGDIARKCTSYFREIGLYGEERGDG